MKLFCLGRLAVAHSCGSLGTRLLVKSIGLKAIFLATTVLGVTSLWMAILADTGATVMVTADALRWR